MDDFSKLQDLVHWLNVNGVDVSQWGTSIFKTPDNLWDEYVRGEVSFQTDPPLRIVRVAQIIINRNNQILLEVEQEFKNGRRRFRSQPPSEKIKPDEDLHDAAIRCLHEELGLDPGQISFVESSYEKRETILESPSYPGLLTRYTIHAVEARVTGLPAQEFWRQNKAVIEGDPVIRHLWNWVTRP